MKSRCEIVFEQCIQSDRTRDNYLYTLRKYKQFVGVQNTEELLEANSKAIQEKVEDFVMYLKKRLNPNSFGSYLAPIFLFYDVNDVVLNKVKIRKMYPAKIKTMGGNAYTREDIASMLSRTRKNRTRCIILIFTSTGCRVSGLCELKMRDVEDVENSQCKSLMFYRGKMTKKKKEHYGFLTPEATKSLEDYFQERIDGGEKLTPDSPVIAINENYNHSMIKNRPITRPAITNVFETLFRGQKRVKDPGGRYPIPTVHGTRKYFNKTMKMRDGCNMSVCEKLMGHSVTIPLDNAYLTLFKNELFKEFEKAIPDLTIRDDERSLLRIKALEKKAKTEDDKERENVNLKEEMEILKLKMERMENTIDV